MSSYVTVWQYTCGHAQDIVHYRRVEDETVIKDVIPIATRCRACILRAVLSVVNPTITSLPESALREVREEIQGMGHDDMRRYFKALSQKVCRPSDAKEFQDALDELVACP